MEKQQRRGIRFPTYPLSEALRLARLVQDQGGGRLSANAAAVALELSPNSSSFGSRVSASKHFGLVEDKEGILVTTSLAKKILRPTAPNQEKEGLSEAFLSFEVFHQLFERFQNNQLPDRSILENILVTEYGISDVSKSMAYDVFLESGKAARTITDTGKSLLVGVQQSPQVESVSETKPISRVLDERLVQLLLDIGSLRTALEISRVSGEGLQPRIESTSRTLLEKTLGLAKELELPATKISLKVLSDRLSSSGLEDASRFALYVEEGLRDDLRLRQGSKA